MKKNFLYTALGLMGIMGTLSIGVVDAAWTIYYGDEETSATTPLIGDKDTWNENFKYKTITISNGTTSYVLMDRNLGATAPWDGETWTLEEDGNNESIMAGYYGYYYQWGNNWGFSYETTIGNVGSLLSSEIPSNYVRSSWDTSSPNGLYNDNMWGELDNTDGARRGPCPSGWHVPSKTERKNVYDAWQYSSNRTNQGAIYQSFAHDLLLPPAGSRGYNTLNFISRGNAGSYWASTYSTSHSNAYNLNYYPNWGVETSDSNGRGYGKSVRCLQNSPTRTVTFTANGETFKSVDVKRGSTVSQPSPAPTTSNGEFSGWYLTGATTAFNFSTAITADIVLFAKFTCSAGYQLKSDWSGCEAISYTVTYNKTENGGEGVNESDTVSYNGQADLTKAATKDGWIFVGWNTDPDAEVGLTSLTITQDIPLYAIFSKTLTGTYTATHASIAGGLTGDTCTMYNKETSCSITLPSVTCDAGYHTPVWSPSNLNGIITNTGATASCTACGDGTYTVDGNTATSCTQCEAGYYCPAGSAKAECTGQTQFSTEGASACSNVEAGYYTTGCDGSNNKCTGQSQCTAGTYCTAGVQYDCVASTDTQIGTYTSEALATSGTVASDGYYVATNNATSQTKCTAGNYCKDGKIISCTTLGVGYTSDAGASAESDCYKILTATFNENGATLSSNSATCNLYYGSGSCPIAAPTITAAAEFDVVGFNTDANATNGTTPTSISADITYYAITKSSSPIQIIFDINGNGGASSTGECYRYNGSGSCSVTSPDITPAAGFTVIGWNADSDTHTSQWNTGTANTVSSSTTYYAQSEKAGYQVTASYTVGTGVSAYSNTPNTCDVEKVYNGASYTACNITLPTLTLRLGYNTGVWSTGTQIENPGAVISLLADETYTASATPNDDTQYLVHYYQQNLSGTYDLFETYTGAGTTDTIATAVEKTYSGFAFSGTNTNNKLTGNIDGYGSLELKLYYDRSEYKLSFVVDGNVVQSGTVAYAAAITAPADPTKDCNAFAGWSSSVAGVTTAGTMPDSDVTFTANWNYTCSRSSGGGGGGGRTTSPIDVVNETLDNNVQNPTDQKENGEIVDNLDNTEGNKSGEAVYSDEFKEAYEFAHSQGITTMPTIQQANMESPLTRIAMAKMLSYYAINVLGQKPDTSKTIKFKDVSNKLNTQYDNGVILAYQLGIMGINMPKNRFRPNDPVTRGEFGTALSRMLYKIADGKKNYYSTHLAKLMEEKIITNDNPNMRELRGYVMIMLKRSAENK